MITIDLARTDDALAIARVYVETWQHTYAGMLPEKVLSDMSAQRCQTEWAWIVRHRHDVQPVIVARTQAGDVVGMTSVGLSRAKDRPSHGAFAQSVAADAIGEVYTLYVHPDWQDRGLGRQLLASGFSALAKRGCSRALLWVVSANPSRFFYERAGGQRIAERVERLWGQSVPQLCYGWPELTSTAQRLAACSAR
jgi:ribosomal protein S18 acetylase RimI-like enzyme